MHWSFLLYILLFHRACGSLTIVCITLHWLIRTEVLHVRDGSLYQLLLFFNVLKLWINIRNEFLLIEL